MNSWIRVAGLLFGAALGSLGPLSAQPLNIDVSATLGTPSATFGAAGSQPGSWNTVGLGVTAGLLDLSGAPTAVSVTVTGGDDTGFTPTCEGDIAALVSDNVFTAAGDWSVTLGGLADGVYRVFLYGPRNTSVDTGDMTVNGTLVPSITGDDCALTEGVSWVSVGAAVAGGILQIDGDGMGFPFAGLAGLQLLPAAIVSIHGSGTVTSVSPAHEGFGYMVGDPFTAFYTFVVPAEPFDPAGGSRTTRVDAHFRVNGVVFSSDDTVGSLLVRTDGSDRFWLFTDENLVGPPGFPPIDFLDFIVENSEFYNVEDYPTAIGDLDVDAAAVLKAEIFTPAAASADTAPTGGGSDVTRMDFDPATVVFTSPPCVATVRNSALDVTRTYESCRDIVVGPGFSVVPPAGVGLFAGRRVSFLNGFETESMTAGACDHDLCAIGDALDAICMPCVSQICMGDPFCCDILWDEICIEQVETVCGIDCPDKTVFVTSTTYDGNLGGLAGADAKCADRALAGGLPGTYKAWLSDSVCGPSCNFGLTSLLPYRRVDGVRVADSWDDLVDSSLQAPIEITEFGAAKSFPDSTWTGTKPDGTPETPPNDNFCLEWSSDDPGQVGDNGDTGAVDGSWTDAGFQDFCNFEYRLYCFEQ